MTTTPIPESVEHIDLSEAADTIRPADRDLADLLEAVDALVGDREAHIGDGYPEGEPECSGDCHACAVVEAAQHVAARHLATPDQPTPLTPEREAQYRTMADAGRGLMPDAWNAALRDLLSEVDRLRAERDQARDAIRAQVLREAAALLDQRATALDAFASSDYGPEAEAVRALADAANEFRRLADAADQPAQGTTTQARHILTHLAAVDTDPYIPERDDNEDATPAATGVEYAIRIPDGQVLDPRGSRGDAHLDALARQDTTDRLARYRDTWPGAVMVTRTAVYSPWTEIADAPERPEDGAR